MWQAGGVGWYNNAVSSESRDLSSCDKGSVVVGKQCLSPGAHVSAESKCAKQQSQKYCRGESLQL